MAEIKYKTQHREDLLSYLKEKKGQHFTVAEVHQHFLETGKPMGTTTIYRQLDRLVGDGLVKKYIIDQNTSACFEYVGEEGEQTGEEQCFHCKCEKCGKLIHLHCDEMGEIREHLKKHHHFSWYPVKTVFYGLCEACQKEEYSESL